MPARRPAGLVRSRGFSPLAVAAAIVAVLSAGCGGTKSGGECAAGGPVRLAFAPIGPVTAGVTFLPQVRILDACGNVAPARAQIVVRLNSVEPRLTMPTLVYQAVPGTTIRLGPPEGNLDPSPNPVPVKLGTVTNQYLLAYGTPRAKAPPPPPPPPPPMEPAGAEALVAVGTLAVDAPPAASVTVAIARDGVATFPFTLVAANTYTLRADSTAYGAAVSEPFTVRANPALSMLVWKQQPRNTAGLASPGGQFLEPIAVAAADQWGNTITSLQGLPIGVALSSSAATLETGESGNAVLFVLAETVDGVATFPDLRLVPTTPPAAGAPLSGLRLTARAAQGTQRFQTDSMAFQLVNPADPAGLVFLLQPANHAHDNSQLPHFRGTRIQLRLIKADGTPWVNPGGPYPAQVWLPNALGAFYLNAEVEDVSWHPGVNPLDLPIPSGASDSAVANVQIVNSTFMGTAGTYYLTANGAATLAGVTLSPATSALFSVSAGPAYSLFWTRSPGNVGVAPRATDATVIAVDSAYNLATGFGGDVLVSIDVDGAVSTSLGGAAADGSVRIKATGGIAKGSFTFSQTGASPFWLGARFAAPPAVVDPALPARSTEFWVLEPGRPARLTFTRQPATVAATAIIGAPDVRVQAVDVDGDPVNAFTGAVSIFHAQGNPTVAFGQNGGWGVDHPGSYYAPLYGTLTRAADGVTGTATFDDVSIGRGLHPASCLLRLSAISPVIPALGEAQSAPFDVAPTLNDVIAPGYPGLAFMDGSPQAFDTASPSGALGPQLQSTATSHSPLFAQAVRGFGTPQVRLLDEFGDVITDLPTTVDVQLAGGTPGARLTGTRSVRTVSGVALFPDLEVDRLGTAYRLVFTSPDFPRAIGLPFDVVAPLEDAAPRE